METINVALRLKEAIDTIAATHHRDAIGFSPYKDMDYALVSTKFERLSSFKDIERGWCYEDKQKDKEDYLTAEDFDEEIEEMPSPGDAAAFIKAYRQILNQTKDDHAGFAVDQLDLKDYKVQVKIGDKEFFLTPGRSMEKSESEELYHLAQVAPFGNADTHVTTIDEEVRKGREIAADRFSVPAEMVERLEKTWMKHFPENEVKLDPYKINLYDEGDFFKAHRDTPHDDVFGTVLIGFDYWPNTFKCDVFVWPEHKYNFCGFYNDLIHEVEPIERRYGIRVTLAFKVHFLGAKEAPKVDSKLCVMFKELMQKSYSFGQYGPTAFVAQHSYGFLQMSEDHMKGGDKDIYKALKAVAPHGVAIVPIICSVMLEDWTNTGCDEDKLEGIELCVRIFPITDKGIQHVSPFGTKRKRDLEDVDEPSWLRHVKGFDRSVPFVFPNEQYLLTSRDHREQSAEWRDGDSHTYQPEPWPNSAPFPGHLWSMQGQDPCVHTGNESRPESVSSVYVNYAFIAY